MFLTFQGLSDKTIKISYHLHFKPQYPTAEPRNYQQNVTVGGAFNSIRESFRNGPEITNWCIFYELPRE